MPYNSAVEIGGVLCAVSEVELKCYRDDNHGFTLSRANYSLF